MNRDNIYKGLNDLKQKRKRTELKSNKVALSLVSDIEQELERFESAESEASYLAYEYGDEILDAFSDFQSKYNLDDYIINGNTTDLEEVGEILKDKLDELQKQSEELGIDPNEIIADFDDLKSRVDNAESVQADAKAKYREILSYVGFFEFWK
mgnify:FL=1